MKYYQLNYSTGQDIGTTYPQSQQAKMDVSFDDSNHLWKVSGKLPDNAYIPNPILHSQANLTDLISTVVLGRVMVISDKLKAIVEKYLKKGAQFFPIQVITRGVGIAYWAMNIYEYKDEYIDFARSQVHVVTYGGKKVKRLNIESYKGFQMAKETFQLPERLLVEDLQLREDIPDDFFALFHGSGAAGVFVSESVKIAIELAGCTGITFSPTNT